MDNNTPILNSHISQWKTTSVLYRIAIGIAITLFLLIVFGWLVIEIYNIKFRYFLFIYNIFIFYVLRILKIKNNLFRKKFKISIIRDRMDGIETKHKLKEIKIKDNNKPKTNANKTLLQSVVINNAKNIDNKVTKIIVDEEEDIKFRNSLTM
jgi:hypothetical protein